LIVNRTSRRHPDRRLFAELDGPAIIFGHSLARVIGVAQIRAALLKILEGVTVILVYSPAVHIHFIQFIAAGGVAVTAKEMGRQS
jgi:hypothetical protein